MESLYLLAAREPGWQPGVPPPGGLASISAEAAAWEQEVSQGAVRTGKRRSMAPRIMLVEDEEPLLELLRYNFEKAGYLVEALGHGEQAEIRLREAVPDLL